MDNKPIELSRQELYELVWSEPIQTLAKRLDISDVGLGKMCKRYNIPKPVRGYWAKLQAGQSVEKAPLPKEYKKNLRPIVFYKSEEEPTKIVDPPEIAEIKAFEKLEENRIRVPKRIHRYHRLVTATGLLASNKRAARILDTLLKALEKRGHEVRAAESGNPALEMLGQKLVLDFREPNKRVPHVLTPEEENYDERRRRHFLQKYDFIPTGKLVLIINGTSVDSADGKISDIKGRPLEERLNDAIVSLVSAAYRIREQRREWDRQHEIYEQEQREREQRKRKLRETAKRERMLFKQAENYRKACDLREYIYAIRDSIESDSDELTRWLEWSIAVADRRDPTKHGYSDLGTDYFDDYSHSRW